MHAGGRNIILSGRAIRTARIDGDQYHFIEDPEPILADLRRSGRRVDLFTFMQRLPDSSPRSSYPMEWDNMAVLPVSTFDNWWTQQIGFKARNKAKQAEKKGVTVREAPFDESLVKGIWEIYNECPFGRGGVFRITGRAWKRCTEMSATFLDSSVFIGAYDGNRLIGFIKLTIDEARLKPE